MFRLVFHPHESDAQTFPLPGGQPLTLGREKDNAIRLDDLSVSRYHARLCPTPEGGWIVEDLQSSNGIRVNGRRLTQAELEAGDEVCFGEMAACYRPATADEELRDAADRAHDDPVLGHAFAGRYRLDRSLGETSVYEAFAAVDLAGAGRPVSLRIFRPGVVGAAGGAAAMAARFEAIRSVPVHPNLTGLMDFAGWRDAAYLAACWVDGQPLLDVLRHRGSLMVAEAVHFARQAAAATTFARAHRLPSPDLHLRAILITINPPAKPRDKPDPWSTLLDKPVSRWPAFTLKITPHLGVPEADYSFGALLCELLGAPPAMPPAGRLAARVVIPSLGEAGNAVLARGLSSRGEAFGGDAAFIEILARAVDPRAYR